MPEVGAPGSVARAAFWFWMSVALSVGLAIGLALSMLLRGWVHGGAQVIERIAKLLW